MSQQRLHGGRIMMKRGTVGMGLAAAARLGALALWATAPVHASGFLLLEQNGSGLGRAFAGTAAAADDASTNYFNVAGLAVLSGSQISVAADGIDLSSHFQNAASQAALGQPLGNNGGNAGAFTVVPSVYVAWRLLPDVTAGLGVNVPFGLKTDYADGWMGRFQALQSEVKTVNVNPGVAWQVAPTLALGVGVDYQRITATLTSAVNDTAVIAQVAPAVVPLNLGLEGASHVDGNDSAWGYNLGLLWSPTDSTRVGLAYRSQISYQIGGNVQFSTPTPANPTGAAILAGASASGGPLSNGSIGLALKIPPSVTASLKQKLTDDVALFADVAWTGWSSLSELRIVRTSGPALGSTLSVTPEGWRDTWRGALGGDFRMGDAWLLRAGVAWDQAPVPGATTRTPRLPDNSRTWLAVGAGFSPADAWQIDAGYAHLLVGDAALNQNNGNALAYGQLNGSQSAHIDVVALQATLKL
jgi:long-chain fatty acid transport protein